MSAFLYTKEFYQHLMTITLKQNWGILILNDSSSSLCPAHSKHLVHFQSLSLFLCSLSFSPFSLNLSLFSLSCFSLLPQPQHKAVQPLIPLGHLVVGLSSRTSGRFPTPEFQIDKTSWEQLNVWFHFHWPDKYENLNGLEYVLYPCYNEKVYAYCLYIFQYTLKLDELNDTLSLFLKTLI